jgi:hypothetical protein
VKRFPIEYAVLGVGVLTGGVLLYLQMQDRKRADEALNATPALPAPTPNTTGATPIFGIVWDALGGLGIAPEYKDKGFDSVVAGGVWDSNYSGGR